MSPARWFVVTSMCGDTLMRGIIGWEETFISSPRWFVVTSIFGDALMRGIIGWEETFMSPPRWFVVTSITGDALMRGIRCSAGMVSAITILLVVAYTLVPMSIVHVIQTLRLKSL